MVKQLGKSLAILTAVFLVLISILSLAESRNKPEPISLNSLAQKITAGEVSTVTVDYNTLRVVLNDGQKLVASKEVDANFVSLMRDYGVPAESLQAVGLEVKDNTTKEIVLNALATIILPLLLLAGLMMFLTRRAAGGANQAFSFGRANIHLFTNFKDRISFKDVAGAKEAKQELEEVVDFLKNPKKFLDLGAKIPRGVLLMGPPGSGKTLLARAVAGEAGVPFFHISASEFVEMFVGVGASRTRDAFQTAKKASPSILFIDEIDAVGRERGAGLGGGHDEREQTLNQILVEMDGFDRDTNVIVLAATNRPDILDPALLRPGRFDRRIVLDLPDMSEREDILRLHSKGKPIGPDVDFKKVSVRTPGFSGADLANVMNESAILAARHNAKVISQQNIYDSIEKVLLGPERRSKIISDKEKNITAFHEAGHALVSVGVKNSDPVHKISIISRGRAGGYTLKLPTEDQRLKTKDQFLADLAVLMAGFVSEKETFGDVSTGASSDLKNASEIARKLVTRFGMSDKLGPITFGDTEELVFLGREISAEKNYSEKVAAIIDDEVRGFIARAERAAQKIIKGNGKALAKIAEALLKEETIEQDEFYRLVKPFGLKPITV
ncbi:MAG: ATP-dependent zinc metalloprotease FtsH [Patescibacteria group bacterium]|nr:ATP-dependent zinc metalloprotease FtsH [Patescibacteria group bacterium]MCL5262181.1 ATP-dependent zinc metalloprotease FtsH [Patescibacteria group bacterium]